LSQVTTIPGASKFLGVAILANRQGIAAQAPTVLGESDTASLLDAGRGVAGGGNGIGLSRGARAVNNQFLNNTTQINELLSLAIGPSATLEGMQQEIVALRSTLPISALDQSVIQVKDDDGGVSGSSTGVEVDEEV
jgi:hypothetical protein